MARVEVKVPQLSESVTEATMLPWKKKAGDAVAQDEILVELETDKVVLEVPAPAAGTLAEVVKKEGDIVHADELLAIIDTEAKASAAAPAPAPAPEKPAAQPAQPAQPAAPAPASTPAAASGQKADFDVIVIGSGPGGYIAAIRAAQLGRKVACVEEWINHAGKPKLGGTCLNVGCIPSKALLASSEQFEKAQLHFGDLGITMDNLAVDVDKMVGRKEAIVEKITGGVEFLFRKNKITWLKGHGKLAGKDGANFKIDVSGDGKSESHTAQHVIIATGSKARHLPNVPVDNKIVSDNEGALAFTSVPKKLAVIGAGVIGLELGSVWRRLGAEVTILEALPEFLGTTDAALQKEAAKLFKKQGLTIHLGVKIDGVQTTDSSVSISYQDKDGNAQTLEADRLIVSIGRVPNTDDLGLDSIGLSADERGFIPVDGHCATQVPNVYAIGDVVRGPMLAHKAEDEGVLGGNHRRAEAAHRLQLHSVGDLHASGNRVGRADRAGAEGRRPRDQGRPVPDARERPRDGHRRNGRLHQDHRGCENGRDSRRAHHFGECVGSDCRSGRGDGVQGGERGYRAHLPSASVAVGGDARGGAGGGQARAEYLNAPRHPHAQQRVKPVDVDRLCQIIARARRETLLLIVLHRLRRDRDDRQLPETRVLADAPRRFESVHAGHHHVHQDDVDVRMPVERFDRLETVTADIHLQPLMLQRAR
jgi:dihydrolipoamide dehydrogenase